MCNEKKRQSNKCTLKCNENKQEKLTTVNFNVADPQDSYTLIHEL